MRGSFFLIALLVVSTIPFFGAGSPAFADTDDIAISNLSINNQLISDNTVISGESILILSAKLTNNNNYVQPFVAVFEIRDSEDSTVLLKLRPSTIRADNQHIARVDWIPDSDGVYTVRVFVLNNIDEPEILSRVASATFQVRLAQTSQAVYEINNDNRSGQIPGTLLHELKNYALEKINDDRERFNLAPIQLTRNLAAQKHAEEILVTKQASHWMTNGEKPYMTYSKFGGFGAVSQNIGLSGSSEYVADCSLGKYLCDRIDPFREIDLHEYDMMYQDDEYDDDRRKNILDAHHTDVSIGIAYDDYSFVIVQNFENNYLDSDRPVFADRSIVEISGSVPRGQIYQIQITYDPDPVPEDYDLNKDLLNYELGALAAMIVNPANDNSELSGTIIPADTWVEKGQQIDIDFSLESIENSRLVYTIVVLFEDEDGNIFPITMFST